MSEVMIKGRLGNDPEARESEKSKFTILSIAENTDYYSNEKKEWVKREPHWFDVICFKSLSERANSLKKGDEIIIWGALKPKVNDVDGKSIKTLLITATRIEKLQRINSKETPQITDHLPSFESEEEIHF